VALCRCGETAMNREKISQVVRSNGLEWILVTAISLLLFLPFLSQQYDTNGLVEALAVESGNLFNKNHVLYRFIGDIAYRGLKLAGYSGRAVDVLQTINALCGALAAGFAYLTYKRSTEDRLASVAGTLFLTCSFVYWFYSTDAAYITLAAMFASASMAVLLYAQSSVSAVFAGTLTALSILTWQASLFLIPALSVLCLRITRDVAQPVRRRAALIYSTTACALSGLAYMSVALARHELNGASSFIRWFTSYSAGGSLPMWGTWAAPRIFTAAGSALQSILPVTLAIPLGQLNWGVQRGRIAVDVALAGLLVVTILATIKARWTAVWFLIAYAFFLPFIVWWDPFVSNWFFVPNLFLAGFFAAGLAPWFRNRFAPTAITGILLLMAATNFVTTIWPRHKDIGLERRIAQCVAENMGPGDLLLAAEWGWPDYLEYLYGRRMLSLISQFSEVGPWLENVHRINGRAYIADPSRYSEAHLQWLRQQSGITPDELLHLADTAAFSCYGRTILFVRM